MRTLAITKNVTVDGSIEMLRLFPDGFECPELRLLEGLSERHHVLAIRPVLSESAG